MVPTIHPVLTFSEAIQYGSSLDVKLLPFELAKGMEETRQVIQKIQPGQSIGILIGPEGGFAPEEAEKAMKAGMHPITLGHRILRTETAGMTILSVLMFQLEEE